MTCPLASEVTLCMPFRSQSPGPVAAPFAAHSVTTRDSPGEKPDACTRTFWPGLSPVAGVTVTFWCPLGAVAEEVAVAEAVAGVVVVAGGGVVVGLRVTGAGLLPHPAASTASTAAAAQRRDKFTMLTCRPRIWTLLVVRPYEPGAIVGAVAELHRAGHRTVGPKVPASSVRQDGPSGDVRPCPSGRPGPTFAVEAMVVAGSGCGHPAQEGGRVSFATLILHNVTVKKLRLTLTALAVAIGVLAVVSLGVVTHSLETSDLALLKTGQADFTIAQKGVADLLSSSIDARSLARIRAVPGVAGVTGVLIGTERLNAANPLFLEIGIDPADLAAFGVTVVAGRPFAASASSELMLGWRAAQNLGLHAGDTLRIGDTTYRITGLYSTGQALGDTGAMLPLAWFQTYQRQPAQYTLLFARIIPGASVTAVQARIDRDFPQLATIRTLEQFGRADRSLSLILAADRGATVLALVIGAIVVMSAMTMSFIERTREFGVLSAVGWTRRRVAAMIMAEALLIGLIGAAGGLALSVLAVAGVQQLPSLAGVLHPVYAADIFGRALYTAAAMVLLGGLVPAIRAALARPLEALRHV